MVDTTVCLLAPKTILPAEALSRFTAEHPELQVRWIEYQEPNELRRARVLGTVTPELQALEPQLTDDDRAALRSAVAVVALDLPTDILELAPNLRFVQAVGAGIEWLLARRLDQQGVVLTNASGVASASIAEFVIGRLLEVWKDIRLIESQQRERVWRPRWAGEMAGRTLGVVGLGAIGPLRCGHARSTCACWRPGGGSCWVRRASRSTRTSIGCFRWISSTTCWVCATRCCSRRR